MFSFQEDRLSGNRTPKVGIQSSEYGPLHLLVVVEADGYSPDWPPGR